MTSAFPPAWTLAATTFSWTPDIVDARLSTLEITTGIIRDGVTDVIELEPGQLWRSFPSPDGQEVDEFRAGIEEAGGRVSIAGLSIDEFSPDGKRRNALERENFLVPQLEAAARVGASGVRLPAGAAGADLLERLRPRLEALDLTLFEEIQGSQRIDQPNIKSAIDTIAALDDPRIRLLIDTSMFMPALPVTYLEVLRSGGLENDLVDLLEQEWQDPAITGKVMAALQNGKVPPPLFKVYMNMVIRYGRSRPEDLDAIFPLVGGLHLKFWDLEDEGNRVSGPIRDVGAVLARHGFTGTVCSEWGGHDWL
jgi:hypothetical protein